MRKKFEGHTRAHLGDSGIVLGMVDAEGCRWGWEGDDPWSPSPSVRQVTGDRASGHGQWDATRFYGPRTVALRGTVEAPSHSALHIAKQRLFSAITVTPFQLLVEEPGFGARVAMVRRNADVLWTERRSNRAATYSLALFAPDPVVYSDATYSYTVPADTAGAQWIEVGATAPAPPLPAAPVLTIGPTAARSITITNSTTGDVMTLASANLVLDPLVPAGQTLTVDCARRGVRTSAGEPRRGFMAGSWLSLASGRNEVMVTPVGATPGVGAVAMAWREGWI